MSHFSLSLFLYLFRKRVITSGGEGENTLGRLEPSANPDMGLNPTTLGDDDLSHNQESYN